MLPQLKNFKVNMEITLERPTDSEGHEIHIFRANTLQTEYRLMVNSHVVGNEKLKNEYEIAFKAIRWANECDVNPEFSIIEKERVDDKSSVFIFMFEFKKFSNMSDFVNFFTHKVLDE